jgi:hypothetical protein
VTEALRRVRAVADELASALEEELGVTPGAAAALATSDNPWLRTEGGAA